MKGRNGALISILGMLVLLGMIGGYFLLLAKLAGVRRRICHLHSTGDGRTDTGCRRLIRWGGRWTVAFAATGAFLRRASAAVRLVQPQQGIGIDAVGITERAAQAIVADLEAAGYLQRERVGRRNQYTVNPAGRFRHPAEADHRIGDLLDLFTSSSHT